MTENPSQEVASDDLFDSSVAMRIRQITAVAMETYEPNDSGEVDDAGDGGES